MHAEATPLTDPGTLTGQLDHEGTLLPVTVSPASRISLYVTFARPLQIPVDRAMFRRLLVDLPDGRTAQLTSCRLHVEYTRRGATGRLVFLDDVYDCRALVTEGKLVNLKGFFQNLPLVLAQKEKILPEFREYVSAAMYDLSVYKKFFNEQDRILANEPAHVAASAQDALLRTEGRNFFRFFDQQLEKLGEIVVRFDKEQHERHGFYFRRHAWEYILGSEFLTRTNLKPRGYAGDAEMMVMAYENAWVGKYVFNKLLHKHPLETPAAQAVRNRRRLVPRVLREVAGRFGVAENLRVMSVACGPATELQDIFVSDEDFDRFRMVLLDQDPEALEFARKCVHRIEAARDRPLRTQFFTDSVRTMLRAPDLKARFGPVHFVYSMGLFDYLTTPVAKALLSRLYELVEPGGGLLIGNFHIANPTRHYMAYWMDWVLYYRTEEQFLDLADGLEGAKATVSYDESRAQMFLRIDRER